MLARGSCRQRGCHAVRRAPTPVRYGTTRRSQKAPRTCQTPDTIRSATCPAQTACSLLNCVHGPNRTTSRTIFGQADALSCGAQGRCCGGPARAPPGRLCGSGLPTLGVAIALAAGRWPQARRHLSAAREDGTMVQSTIGAVEVGARAGEIIQDRQLAKSGLAPMPDTGTMRTCWRHTAKRACGFSASLVSCRMVVSYGKARLIGGLTRALGKRRGCEAGFEH